MDLWQPRTTTQDETLYWQAGPLKLWLRRNASEWLVAAVRDLEDEDTVAVASREPESEDLEWKRWAAVDDSCEVRMVPAMPDRPVIVRPETPLKFPPKAEALFYARVPLWVRVTVGAKGLLTLCEEPTVILSNSWFGDPMHGELCYSMRTSARRSTAGLPPRPHRAVCPILIRNSSDEEFEFERICVRVDHLNIYEGTTGMCTNRVLVTFRGEDRPSRIDVEKQPPSVEGVSGTLELVTEAREPAEQSLFRKSFMSLAAFGP